MSKELTPESLGHGTPPQRCESNLLIPRHYFRSVQLMLARRRVVRPYQNDLREEALAAGLGVPTASAPANLHRRLRHSDRGARWTELRLRRRAHRTGWICRAHHGPVGPAHHLERKRVRCEPHAGGAPGRAVRRDGGCERHARCAVGLSGLDSGGRCCTPGDRNRRCSQRRRHHRLAGAGGRCATSSSVMCSTLAVTRRRWRWA